LVEIALNKKVDYEQDILNISARLVNSPNQQVDEIIIEGLHKISLIFDSDWTTLMQYNEDLSKLTVTHEWIADKGKSSAKVFRVWYRRSGHGYLKN
jgi:hypothetical protein